MRPRRRPVSPPPSAARQVGIVPLSCPDCFGVLRFEREGVRGHLLYRCQVDHRYSVTSLIDAKETHLERTLWSAALLLTQMVYAYEDCLSEIRSAKTADRTRVRRRIAELKKQCLAIRAVIEATHAVE